jgi:hypothetical protein
MYYTDPLEGEDMAAEDRPTEIPGIHATLSGDEEIFQARKPYEWAGHAIVMLFFAATRGEVPEALKRHVDEINYGADAVVGSADAESPLGPSQIAAAQLAYTVVHDLAELGFVEFNITGE